MPGSKKNFDDQECYPSSIRTDVATEGALGIPIPGPLVPRGYITLKQWIERANEAANKAPDNSQSESRAEAALREALAADEVASELLTSDGDRLPVLANRWRSETFWESAYMGHPAITLNSGKAIQGILIVEETGSAPVLGRLEVNGAQPTADWTPELALMVRAVAEIPIKRDDRTLTKDSIAEWLEKNAPPGLTISRPLREQMASILMSAELRKGGRRTQGQHQGLRARGL